MFKEGMRLYRRGAGERGLIHRSRVFALITLLTVLLPHVTATGANNNAPATVALDIIAVKGIHRQLSECLERRLEAVGTVTIVHENADFRFSIVALDTERMFVKKEKLAVSVVLSSPVSKGFRTHLLNRQFTDLVPELSVIHDHWLWIGEYENVRALCNMIADEFITNFAQFFHNAN